MILNCRLISRTCSFPLFWCKISSATYLDTFDLQIAIAGMVCVTQAEWRTLKNLKKLSRSGALFLVKRSLFLGLFNLNCLRPDLVLVDFGQKLFEGSFVFGKIKEA